jgi:hypothetical protein
VGRIACNRAENALGSLQAELYVAFFYNEEGLEFKVQVAGARLAAKA